MSGYAWRCRGERSCADTYTLGFYLADTERDETSHSIKVRVARPHVELFYRQAYFADGEPKSLHERKPEMDSVLLDGVDASDGWTGNVEEEFVEMNESGYTLAKVSDTKHFDVAKSERARYDREGVAWPFTMALTPGTAQIVIVVRDSKSSKLGSLTIPLRVKALSMKTFMIVTLAMPLMAALADPPPPVPTMRAETRVVQIDVVVTDSEGKPVGNFVEGRFCC